MAKHGSVQNALRFLRPGQSFYPPLYFQPGVGSRNQWGKMVTLRVLSLTPSQERDNNKSFTSFHMILASVFQQPECVHQENLVSTKRIAERNHDVGTYHCQVGSLLLTTVLPLPF